MTIASIPSNPKSKTLASLLGLLVVACGGSDSSSPPNGPIASAFHLNAAHSGFTSFQSPLSFPAAPTWQVSLDGTASYPLIADGKVFIVVGGNGAGGAGTRLQALDITTGTSVWGPVPIAGAGTRSGHAFAAGRIYVTSHGGSVEAFSAATGQRKRLDHGTPHPSIAILYMLAIL